MNEGKVVFGNTTVSSLNTINNYNESENVSLYFPNGNYYYAFKAGPIFAVLLDSGDGNDMLDKDEIKAIFIPVRN